jgi:putative endonuclease
VLAANVWLAGAELDLVVRRGRTVVFVEVKSKAGDGFGDPLEMVTPVKVARIRRAAAAWLARRPAERIRFDVAAERSGRMEVRQDAF